MKCFVTGGTGKLGQALVAELLKRGHEVRMLVRDSRGSHGADIPKGALVIKGDLSNVGALEVGTRGADVVFHCAALVDPAASWEELRKTNVDGTRNLAEACVKTPIMRFVHVSSIAVYGKKPAEIPVSEGTPTRPDSPYGKSKFEAERVLGEYVSNFPISIIRPGIIYGPTFLDVYVRVLRMLEKGSMQILGDGKNVIPFVHSSDVIDAMIRCTMTDFAIRKTYVIGENTTVTQEQVYKAACDSLGVPFKKQYMNPALAKALINVSSIFRKSSVTEEDIGMLAAHRPLNTTRAEKELGWKAKTMLHEGIKEMVGLYRTNKMRSK